MNNNNFIRLSYLLVLGTIVFTNSLLMAKEAKHKNVLFISVDVFEEGRSNQGVIRTGVTGEQLVWMDRVMAEHADVDHIIVMLCIDHKTKAGYRLRGHARRDKKRAQKSGV